MLTPTRLLWLVLCLSGFIIPHSVEAKTNNIEVHPIYTADGNFGFCLASYAYQDGRKFTLALSPDLQLNIGLTIPNGHFKRGAKYDISFSLDHGGTRQVRAFGLNDSTTLLQMGTNPTLLKQLATSQNMSVGAKGQTQIGFGLPAMDNLMGMLRKCVDQKKGTHDEKTVALQKIMPESLRELLIGAGFTNMMPVDIGPVPIDERPADYIWQVGDIMAGVREFKVPADKTLDDFVGVHMRGLKTECKETFDGTIGKEQVIGKFRLRTAQASCGPAQQTDKDTVTVALVFYITPTGTFTVFTHEASNNAQKTEALKDRDQLAAHILAIAQEMEATGGK